MGIGSAVELCFGGGNKGILAETAWSGRNGLVYARNCVECVYLVFIEMMDVVK